MRLYLDEMISPVAAELRRRGYDVVATVERQALGNADARQLALAIRERRALVTYHVRDFAVLARALAHTTRSHPGIIFVSHRRLPPADIGALVQALERLPRTRPGRDALENVTVFLGPSRSAG